MSVIHGHNKQKTPDYLPEDARGVALVEMHLLPW